MSNHADSTVPPPPRRIATNTSTSTLTDYHASNYRMKLFSNTRSDTTPSSASPYTPATALTDMSWDESSPPPYDVAMGHGQIKSPERAVVAGRGNIQNVEAQTGPSSSSSVGQNSNGLFELRGGSKRQISRKKTKSFSRPRRPGIKVDTTVTRHRGDAPQQMFPPQSFFNRSDSQRPNGAWVRKVSQLKRARGSRNIRNDASSTSPSPQQQAANTSPNRGPPHSATSELYSADVTPSDRAIPIALCTPPDQSSNSPHLEASYSSDSMPTRIPTTGTTPVQNNLAWFMPQSTHNTQKAPRPRPASSVYSQYTWTSPQPGETPPMPPLPPGVIAQPTSTWSASQRTNLALPAERRINPRESSITTFEEQDDDQRYQDKTRSAGTDFEEDRTPESAQSFKQRFARRPKGLEIDTTIPTPRRSRGWWNVITTPFESNRPGTRSFRSPNEDGSVPELPDMNEAVTRYQMNRKNSVAPATNPTASSQLPRSNAQWDGTSQLVQPLRAFENSGRPTAAPGPLETREPDMFIHLDRTDSAKKSRTDERHDSQHEFKPCIKRELDHVNGQDASLVKNDSQGSTFSPEDRDVPIVLDSRTASLAKEQTGLEHGQPQPKTEKSDSNPQVSYHFYFGQPGSTNHITSPFSERTETPVIETASLGMMYAAKEVENTPSLPYNPFRSNAPAPLHDLPSREPESRFSNFTSNHPGSQRAPSPPPLTSFPHASTYYKRESTRIAFPPPPLNTNVRSIWEKESPEKVQDKPRRGCCGNRRTKHKKTKKEKKKRRCLLCCICVALLVLVGLIVILAVTLTRRRGGSAGSTQTQWLNLTGFPPIPTGVMTIAQPTLLAKVDGCTRPTALWSCDLPKEDQQANLPGGPDEPNFKLEIRFSNNSISNSSALQPLLRFKRDLGGSPFTPSPAPPTEEDQIFIGNTTDLNNEPFQGEDTPFFLSFLPTTPGSSNSNRVKRSTPTSTRSSTQSSTTADFATAIPSPSTLDDGTAAPANLLPSPLPSAQPLKLYNRGTDKEHYGFYAYFDRSIFLKSLHVANISEVDTGQIPADQNGGSTKEGAIARCTWRETRFLVQIWTRLGQDKLLSASTNSSSEGSSDSANDFARPGSFPYPITITTDRHGGTPSGKMIYCYALDENERPVPLNKTLYFEERDFQGTLVNPAQGPFMNVTIDPKDGGPGGMDGGSGGCGCRWGNWGGSTSF